MQSGGVGWGAPAWCSAFVCGRNAEFPLRNSHVCQDAAGLICGRATRLPCKCLDLSHSGKDGLLMDLAELPHRALIDTSTIPFTLVVHVPYQTQSGS